MEFVFIIIVVVIISVISAAPKKKPKSSGQPAAPPRPMMSDLRRAFMMAAGLPDEHPQQRSAPGAPSAPAYSYNPTYAPYVPDQPAAVSVAPAIAESYEGLTARNVVRPVAVPSASPFAGVQMGAYFMDDEEPENVMTTPVQQSPMSHTAPLALFENQQDIVKAFIYAEILPRRGSVPHIR